MPSYTHLRRAQPVLVAHFFLSHASALRRDYARLAAAADEADALTLGSGAIAGTSYAVDTARLARALGFSRVVRNSMDASSDRDFVASFLYAVSLAMVHLSRLAEDLIIFTGEEHGFFELADASATGSSMMPQKKNPDPLELVRGKTGRAIGRLTGWLVDDEGSAERLQQGSAGRQGSRVRRRGDAGGVARRGPRRRLAAVDQRRAHRAARPRVCCWRPTSPTTWCRAACRSGAPTKSSGAMVRRLLAEGRDFSDLTMAEWREASDMFGEDAPRAATALASVQARRTPQSTNPDAVRAALEECRAWLQRRRRAFQAFERGTFC